MGAGDKGIDLFGGVAGVGSVGGEEVRKIFRAETEARIGGEAGEQIVLTDSPGAEIFHRGDGVLFDGFMRGLAASALFYGFHHDSGGEQEGQVAEQFLLDDGFEHFHLMQDGEEGLKQTVGSEEGVGQHDAADHGTGDIALVPLITSEPGGHGEVAFEDEMEAVDALAGARVHLVRHGGGADLAFGEAFAGEFVTGHEAQRAAKG